MTQINKKQQPVTIKRRGSLPKVGQITWIGGDTFTVVAIQPAPDLFRFSEDGDAQYHADVPLVQRERGGQKVGQPLPFPIFGQVRWSSAEVVKKQLQKQRSEELRRIELRNMRITARGN